MVLFYQPPNAHVRISGILPSHAMVAAAVKKIYRSAHVRISGILPSNAMAAAAVKKIVAAVEKIDLFHGHCVA
jgi:hypothetical protein